MRRALITGGGRGIGRAIALGLAGQSHAIAVTARSVDELESVRAEAIELGAPAAAGLAADLTDPFAAARVADDAAHALGGPVEIFVHAAGVASIGALPDLDPRAWELAFAVNVHSAFHIAQAVMGPMIEGGWGRVVTVASLRARVGVPTTAAYTASKHALLGLTRVISAELAPHGATANAVVPGWVDTRMVRDEIDAFAALRNVTAHEAQRRLLRDQTIGRMLEPEEVASLVCYLCGEAAGGVTGQAIHIDGGSFQA